MTTLSQEARQKVEPLTKDHFLVDNSMIEDITTCPWLAYGSIVRRLRPRGDAPPLRFGGFLHRALGYRYKITGFGKPWSEDCQVRILSKVFERNPCAMEGYRNCDNAVKVIRGYNLAYPKDNFEVMVNSKTGHPFVEQPFAVDTHRTLRGRKIIYTGKIDLKIRTQNKMVFIQDFKTTSMLGDSFWQDQAVSPQYRGYLWADRECTGEEATGYIVSALGIRDSIQWAEWDDKLGKLVPGITASGRQSKAVPLEFMAQSTFTKVPKGQLDEWFENMLQIVDVFLYYVDTNTFPRHRRHCVHKYGTCRFYNVCSLPVENREAALTSSAYQANEWTPLYR